MEVDKIYLSKLISHQMSSFFIDSIDVSIYIDETLARLDKCFKNNGNKYYSSEGEALFSPFHSVQYSIYLYYLANTIFKVEGSNETSEKIYYLNKIMHSVDWYYQIELPNIFGAEHPLGSVMGRADYSDYFYFYQGCTVGGNKFKYPKIGKNVIMYSNSTVLGDSKIGNNVILSSGSLVKDVQIPDNSIVFGQSPNLIIKQKGSDEINNLTQHFWR